jgi:hypothetical protein
MLQVSSKLGTVRLAQLKLSTQLLLESLKCLMLIRILS